MKLNIIITHYKEPWETCFYLLNSIAMQRNVPWDEIGVTIVNDGDDPTLDDVNWDAYPYKVEYLKKPHGGVSAARNYGLDHSEAEYIMWCDIDDGFLNNYGLHMLMSAVAEGFDFMIGAFAEEAMSSDDRTIALIGHQSDMTFVHGKVYRREFLTKYNLRFDDEMTIHEDGYFNALVYSTAKVEKAKIKKIATPFYLWCWNENSVVRSDKEDFVLKTYPKLIQTRTGLARQLKDRGYQEEYEASVCMTVLNCYYDHQKASYWTAKNEKYRKIAEKAFKEYWNEFKKTFYDQTNAKIAELAKAARDTAYQNGLLLERESLKEFLKRIDGLK
mgnify:CR=1 FL=1